MKITLITGGARSGKSTEALKRAIKIDGRRAFLATAAAIDEEMKLRIKNHQEEREGLFTTFEEQYNIESVLLKTEDKYDCAIIDCLSTWLGNIYYENDDDESLVKKRVSDFISFLQDSKSSMNLFIVTNEVGCGIIPENSLARAYRDMLGFLNYRIAEIADSVMLSVCGIPVKIK